MGNSDAGHTPVTVLGLGLMGQALARAFLRDGHPTTVWNRTSEKAERLVAEGATLAGSVGDAVAASPLVVVCVSDYDTVRGLLEPLGEALRGRVVVNLTSGTSAQARETAEWLGDGYLDGAIMAIPPAIGAADTTILYSGPRTAFEEHKATLRSLGGDPTYLGGDHGLSSLYDVAMLGLMWGIGDAFLHGVALLGAAGVDATTFVPFARKVIGTVTDWLPGYARQVDEGSYPADDASIDTHLAAMDHLIHESEAAGVNAELPQFFKALTERAVADGRGGDSYTAMIEQFRKAS
ncbi:NAD(P)-dependent oxidoreductase [Micromonospora sp. CPCC 206061]|uniref:NAD(P)-dependent oxidoreductase n=1 Tax=Micromonospora sp. CPCC 206061 TaxID=3122410 RepID=UPI002FF36908